MKKIKFLTGPISLAHPVAFIIIFLPAVILPNSIEKLLLCLIISIACVIELFRNGSEQFLFIRNNKIYAFKFFPFFKTYPLNESTHIYYAQARYRPSRNIIRTSPYTTYTGSYSYIRFYDIYIITKSGDLRDNKISLLHDKNGNLINDKNIYMHSNDLFEGRRKILILKGNRKNYLFLRQFVDREQFVGLTETHNNKLNVFEGVYQKTAKKAKQKILEK